MMKMRQDKSLGKLQFGEAVGIEAFTRKFVSKIPVLIAAESGSHAYFSNTG
jgi:hypothetical protein